MKIERKNNEFDNKFPQIEEGELVVISPLKFTKGDKEFLGVTTVRERTGYIVRKGVVTYTICMLDTGSHVSISRMNFHKPIIEELLEL